MAARSSIYGEGTVNLKKLLTDFLH
jgi:hypothetical protein